MQHKIPPENVEKEKESEEIIDEASPTLPLEIWYLVLSFLPHSSLKHVLPFVCFDFAALAASANKARWPCRKSPMRTKQVLMVGDGAFKGSMQCFAASATRLFDGKTEDVDIVIKVPGIDGAQLLIKNQENPKQVASIYRGVEIVLLFYNDADLHDLVGWLSELERYLDQRVGKIFLINIKGKGLSDFDHPQEIHDFVVHAKMTVDVINDEIVKEIFSVIYKHVTFPRTVQQEIKFICGELYKKLKAYRDETQKLLNINDYVSPFGRETESDLPDVEKFVELFACDASYADNLSKLAHLREWVSNERKMKGETKTLVAIENILSQKNVTKLLSQNQRYIKQFDQLHHKISAASASAFFGVVPAAEYNREKAIFATADTTIAIVHIDVLAHQVLIDALMLRGIKEIYVVMVDSPKDKVHVNSIERCVEKLMLRGFVVRGVVLAAELTWGLRDALQNMDFSQGKRVDKVPLACCIENDLLNLCGREKDYADIVEFYETGVVAADLPLGAEYERIKVQLSKEQEKPADEQEKMALEALDIIHGCRARKLARELGCKVYLCSNFSDIEIKQSQLNKSYVLWLEGEIFKLGYIEQGQLYSIRVPDDEVQQTDQLKSDSALLQSWLASWGGAKLTANSHERPTLCYLDAWSSNAFNTMLKKMQARTPAIIAPHTRAMIAERIMQHASSQQRFVYIGTNSCTPMVSALSQRECFNVTAIEVPREIAFNSYFIAENVEQSVAWTAYGRELQTMLATIPSGENEIQIFAGALQREIQQQQEALAATIAKLENKLRAAQEPLSSFLTYYLFFDPEKCKQLKIKLEKAQINQFILNAHQQMLEAYLLPTIHGMDKAESLLDDARAIAAKKFSEEAVIACEKNGDFCFGKKMHELLRLVTAVPITELKGEFRLG